jgi:hypothetical protein
MNSLHLYKNTKLISPNLLGNTLKGRLRIFIDHYYNTSLFWGALTARASGQSLLPEELSLPDY